jgi:hypothetical protein
VKKSEVKNLVGRSLQNLILPTVSPGHLLVKLALPAVSRELLLAPLLLPDVSLCCMRNPVDSHNTIMSLYNSIMMRS